jgi:diaminopimelate epimerase
MKINFSKYQGTGNDFVMIDCIAQPDIQISNGLIQNLCNRRFGIGADGLICISAHDNFDFEMRYFNSDGSRSFCGNGARCAVAFAHELGLFEKDANFLAIDGAHTASWDGEKVFLRMNDVDEVKQEAEHFIMDTGSPHYISFCPNLKKVDIVNFGQEIRYSDRFKAEGINVNAVEITSNNSLSILTYERGVEAETFSCGTGATAAALAYAKKLNAEELFKYSICVKGGTLKVQAKRKGNGFEDIYLIGPAVHVFSGTIELD